MAEKLPLYPIGAVERDTGIGRDTLRIWERRYGFPTPQRNEQGERLYDAGQVRRLQRLRRLLDQGLRPGKVLRLDDTALDQLETSLGGERPAPEMEKLILAVETVDRPLLLQELEHRYRQQGLAEFVLRTVAPLLENIGNSWASGQIQIYHEHFATTQLVTFISARLEEMTESEAGPAPVLLATLPGEQHTLGLLMVHALLACAGHRVINLGGEMPLDQLVKAASRFGAAAVGLTFSAAYPYKHVRVHLQELREQLPPGTAIWIGGEAIGGMRKLPEGVRKFKNLQEVAACRP